MTSLKVIFAYTFFALATLAIQSSSAYACQCGDGSHCEKDSEGRTCTTR